MEWSAWDHKVHSVADVVCVERRSDCHLWDHVGILCIEPQGCRYTLYNKGAIPTQTATGLKNCGTGIKNVASQKDKVVRCSCDDRCSSSRVFVSGGVRR